MKNNDLSGRNILSDLINNSINLNNNNNNIIITTSSQNIDDGTQVDIKVPKPYPKAKNIRNSENQNLNNYTDYPKKHNQIFQQQISNNSSYKNLPINNYNDFNLKIIDFNPQEIETKNTTNLEESIDLINKLKEKCVNFQMINNTNVENTTDLINKLKEQNQLYLNKINELYDTLDLIEKNFNIDTNHLNPNDAVYINVKNFRETNLKKYFFKNFKQFFYRNKYLKKGILNLQKKKEVYLKLKSFIIFEKLTNIKNFKKNLYQKRKMNLIVKAYKGIKENFKFNILKRKFSNHQKYLNLLFCLKNFKLQSYLYKIKKHNTRKALLHYYLKTTKKVLKILNSYSLFKTNNQNLLNNDYKKPKINYIKFNQYILNKYQNKFDKELKFNKIRELTLINNIFKKIENNKKNKLVNNINKNNKTIILKYYFDCWLGSSDERKLNKVNNYLKDSRLKQFYKITLDSYKNKNNYDIFANNIEMYEQYKNSN